MAPGHRVRPAVEVAGVTRRLRRVLGDLGRVAHELAAITAVLEGNDGRHQTRHVSEPAQRIVDAILAGKIDELG